MTHRRWILGGLVVGLIPSPWHAADARPKYKKCYEEVFKEEIADSKGSKLTCNLCHEGDSKKNRNSYGKKLADELGETNVKDEDKIKEALKKIGPAKPHKKPEPKPDSLPDPNPKTLR